MSIAVFAVAAALAQGNAAPAGGEAALTFERDIIPLLRTYCLRCHGEGPKPKAKLDVRLRRALLKGGASGPSIVPGRRHESLLYTKVASGEMPEGHDRPSAAQIETLGRWIDAGAPTARPEPEGPVDPEAPLPEDLEFWSHRPIRRPPLPEADGASHPVDRFLQPRRASRGLVPQSPAARETLLRRATLDLTGLPPGPAELRAFAADPSPLAYESVVDRLLASSRFGERWGRHWMDIWRYCDETVVVYDGKPLHYVGMPQMWRWRDWIVESLNADKGYDRMALEMLAGDEVAPDDPNTLRATGFLVRNRQDVGGRDLWLQSVVEHTGSAFLGVTFKCARCHSHKYDPVSQDDYYRLRAFFEPMFARVDRIPGEPSILKDGIARAFDRNLKAPTYVYAAGDVLAPDKDRVIVPGLPRVFHPGPLVVRPIPLPPAAFAPDAAAWAREHHRRTLARQAGEALLNFLLRAAGDTPRLEVVAAGLEATAARSELEAYVAAVAAKDIELGLARGDAAGAARRAGGLQRQARAHRAEAALARARALAARPDPKRRAEADRARASLPSLEAMLKAAREDVRKEAKGFTPPYEVYPRESSGRRLALARWIGSRENPRTARVVVNHVWMRHFGQPLVPTVYDFGRNGSPPTHPELLDWLAAEFMEGGWSLKRLHRLIVTSAAYRMSSARRPGHPNERIDPDNVQYWRMNPRRMEAEAVRDSLLALSGSLDLTLGGPPIEASKADQVARRSLYLRHPVDETLRAPFLALFNSPDPEECYRREATIIPQQALGLSNSAFARDAADRIARELAGAGDVVGAAFEKVLGRAPSEGERADCLRFLERAPAATGRADLVHVLLNHNDFITIR